MKRAFDLAGLMLALLVFAPAFVVIAALIWLDDRGPVFFLQERLGIDRRPFRTYKFRTMRNSQVTRMGSFLRPTGLDELPQFLNVLRGDMSIVGPRPLTQQDVDRLGWNGPEMDRRWQIHPGITGLAQLHFGKGAAASLSLDLEYVRSHSPLLDARLIGISFLMNLLGKRRVQGWLF